MLRAGKRPFNYFSHFPKFSSHISPPLAISKEVEDGIAKGLPVVALESAILTHGMPYPQNIQTAFSVQKIIRQMGAIPATVGVLQGKLTVGLTDEQIEILGNPSTKSVKVSRRDFPFVLSNRLNGGTTVAGTIIGAVKAKIPIFVTGGIGGVHRGASETFDISGDLRELGRSSITIVSAGVKSILDIGKSLEYLETEGVCVCVLKETSADKSVQIKFPSFFTSESSFEAPYVLRNEDEAAELIGSANRFGFNSGILIAVPIPKEAEASGAEIEELIHAALNRAKELKISGKDTTPFILQELNQLSGGGSLATNVSLIENNARVGAAIAVKVSKLLQSDEFSREEKTLELSSPIKSVKKGRSGGESCKDDASQIPIQFPSTLTLKEGRPVVVGGSSLDLIFSVNEEIVSDGRTHHCGVRSVPGGVGRNMAEALKKHGQNPLLISAVGNDLFARHLSTLFQEAQMDQSGIFQCESEGTSVYGGILNSGGECVIGLGAMKCHGAVGRSLVEAHRHDIARASVVIMDGNLPMETMELLMEICTNESVPVWFEPTEKRKANKILEIPRANFSCIKFISPNLSELISILAGGKEEGKYEQGNWSLEVLGSKAAQLFPHLQIILLTRGSQGISVLWREEGGEFEFCDFGPPVLDTGLVSVSGGGDCLNSGFISGMLAKESLSESVRRGIGAAKDSLQSFLNVPNNFTQKK